MKDSYFTLQEESEGEFRDRGSKFIAYAAPVYSEDEGHAFLDKIRKIHPKSRHCCYAYRLGIDQNNFRANDDGEPSGTAGRPILGQIDKFEITNVIIAVIRYFGGTLLGTSGLINAYRNSAAEAIQNGTKIERIIDDVFELTFDYAIMSDVMNAIKKNKIDIILQDFGAIGKIQIAIRQSETEQKMRLMRAQIAKVRIEEIDDIELVEGLEIENMGVR